MIPPSKTIRQPAPHGGWRIAALEKTGSSLDKSAAAASMRSRLVFRIADSRPHSTIHNS
jgi:hypothetical protein